ncbi:MAG: 50S ribosomal protein L15 [Bacteroidetes bacterium]|nr:50S ribosomal protein L15 [Bacteroidota bacterium]
MDLSNLKPAEGSVKKNKRIGRGQGSGRGGTATRGHKGAKSRSGYKSKSGFEGGQMPIQRRLPKFGFKSLNRVEYKGINLDVLQGLYDKKGLDYFDMEVFIEHGFASSRDKIKVLGRGILTAKIDVKAHAFSEKAMKTIETVGGTATKI